MSTLAEIEAAADNLPLHEVEHLLQHLTVRLSEKTKPLGKRIAELHPGAFQPAADFDAPLGDDFWLGKDE
jgi:hypothetical protein